MEIHKIETIHREGMAFSTDMQGHEIMIDATEEHGGQNKGPRPKNLLLKSLAGCTGMDVVSLLRKMRVEFSDFKIGVSGELTDEHPKHYHTITLDYQVKLADEKDQAKFEKAVNLSQDRYCGVSAMLSKAAEIKYHITYLK
jgi:putative redox protein